MPEAVLVTGGSGGIGTATCRALAEAGFLPVVGYASGRERALAVAEETQGLALACDMADPAAIDAAIARIATETTLAGVVLAASPPPALVPFTKITDELERQWRVNVAGPRRLLAGLIKACFRPRRAGVAVAVLTRAMGLDGAETSPGMADYVIAKHGLLGVVKAAGAEYPWLRTGIVAPGFTETAMLTAFDERYLDQARAAGRFATPDEVAAEIVAMVRGA
ncbi:MAG: SDR family NAD(P)-dependent oxidoreductase [Magnetospirillum sp.]|nr:SDR family NAD(P)-dependent oxidoreductase [Magnetospirillum sp.]